MRCSAACVAAGFSRQPVLAGTPHCLRTLPDGRHGWMTSSMCGPTLVCRRCWLSAPDALRRTGYAQDEDQESPSQPRGARASPATAQDPPRPYDVGTCFVLCSPCLAAFPLLKPSAVEPLLVKMKVILTNARVLESKVTLGFNLHWSCATIGAVVELASFALARVCHRKVFGVFLHGDEHSFRPDVNLSKDSRDPVGHPSRAT